MNNFPIIRLLILILPLLVSSVATIQAQKVGITLEEALRIARENHTALERDQLLIQQQSRLAEDGLLTSPTQIFVTGEEFNFDGQSGVQSFNIQQNFYLPKAGKAQRAYYRQGMALAEKQMALTEQELKRQVEQAYYKLQYAEQQKNLADENLNLYNNFLTVTTAHQEKGETGKIPQLAARTRVSRAKLSQNYAEEQYEIALILFNKWLRSDVTYEAAGELLIEQRFVTDTSLLQNPHLLIIEARQNLATAKVETEKSRLLPQINSGVRLQNAFGDFPLYGYQLGVNVPLFRKSYNTRIDAARIGVKVEETALSAEKQELDRTISELRFRISQQLNILEHLQNELQPIVIEQSEVTLYAYREGEISYLEYLDSLEQTLEVKQQHLNALYQFNALQAELDYWLGK